MISRDPAVANANSSFTSIKSDVSTLQNQRGLVFIGSNTATSGTTLNVLSCFSSTYDTYKIVVSDCRITSGQVSDLYLKLLVGTTPNASNWIFAVNRVDYAAGTVGAYRASSQASMLGNIISGNSLSCEITVGAPNLPRYTTVTGSGSDSRGTTGYFAIAYSGQLENTTQYNGIQLITGAGSFVNCHCAVYGCKK